MPPDGKTLVQLSEQLVQTLKITAGCLQDLCQLYMEGQLEMLKVSFSFITNFLKLTLSKEMPNASLWIKVA